MGNPPLFTPVQLFTGVIYQNQSLFNDICSYLEKNFKMTIESISDVFMFDHSSYYNSEMGDSLKRVFISFDRIVSPDIAYNFKIKSNEIESNFINQTKRQCNIDPGILSLHNIVLFSTKNFSHRIACGQGIYSELTLLYHGQKFKSLEWTYPDFKQLKIQDFFKSLRSNYQNKLSDQGIHYA